jgi:hypothetical protein
MLPTCWQPGLGKIVWHPSLHKVFAVESLPNGASRLRAYRSENECSHGRRQDRDVALWTHFDVGNATTLCLKYRDAHTLCLPLCLALGMG